MKYINNLSEWVSKITGINKEYIILTIISLIVIIIINIIRKVIPKFVKKVNDEKKEFTVNHRLNLILTIIEWLIIIIIWENHISNIMTFISFISAAITISIRDIIFNFFSGIYIKTKKIFQIEDRIEINGYKGDVISINGLNFELLEIEEGEFGQSTGKIIILPNSLAFTTPIKNYNKAFKYIWDEIKVNVPLDSDLVKCKNTLYKIINNNEIIKAIPTKMKKQVNISKSNYRLYFNKYDPIIYTKVCDKYVELSVRYLMHPKKSRYINSVLWNNILNAYKNGEIDLYKE